MRTSLLTGAETPDKTTNIVAIVTLVASAAAIVAVLYFAIWRQAVRQQGRAA